MKRILLGGLAAVCLVVAPRLASAWGYGDTLTVIWKPLPNLPTILRPGDTLTVWANAPPAPTSWSARLRLGTVTVALPAVDGAYDAGRVRWILTFQVPPGVPEETWDLILTSNATLPDTARHAVKVIPAFRHDYYFAQISDTHLPTHALSENGIINTADTSGMTDFDAVIEDLNILHPEFILHSGDLVNEGELEEYLGMYEMGRALNMFSQLHDPVFLSSGNHDIGGWGATAPPDGTSRKNWWRYFGWPFLGSPPPGDPYHSQDYSFDYDSLHVIALEAYINNGSYDHYMQAIWGAQSFTQEQLNWLAADIAAAGSKHKLAFYHYDFGGTLANGNPGPEFSQINPGALGLDGAIWGHNHVVAEDKNTLHTAHPFNLGMQAVIDGKRTFRIYRVHNGNISPGIMHHSGTSTDSLALAWSGPNDGTRSRLTATVTNRFGETWDHARLVFSMLDDDSVYTATGGTVAQWIPEGGRILVYVDCVLPAGGVTNVSVFPNAPVGVGGELPVPFRLERVAQNPVVPGPVAVRFRFSLPSASDATLAVYDVAGRQRAEVYRGRATAGDHEAAWQGRSAAGEPLSTGVYWVRLTTRFGVKSQKIVVVR